MNVFMLVGGVYGFVIGSIIVALLIIWITPWLRSWLLNKFSRQKYGVAVIMTKWGGIPFSVPIGKPIETKDRLWIWDDDVVIPLKAINTDDGKVELKPELDKVKKLDRSNVFNIFGVPTIFLDLEDLKPLKLEKYGKEIPNDRIKQEIDRYMDIRKAQALTSMKKVDVRILLILLGVVVTFLISAYTLWNVLQLISQINALKGMVAKLTAPGIHPAPVEANTVATAVKTGVVKP